MGMFSYILITVRIWLVRRKNKRFKDVEGHNGQSI